MALMDFIKKQFIDVIQWTEDEPGVLAYLAKLPVQTLKIDRSFIITMLNDPDTMTLVQTMISLAHSLRLTVVAEGVDAEEQAKMLRLLRCDQMQGYLFSRPVPFEQITALLMEKARG